MTELTLWERTLKGESFPVGSRMITDELVQGAIGLGKYVHPLFVDPERARALGFASTPLPGQAVLMVIGGLTEAHPAFGPDVIALLGFDEIQFRRPALAGDDLDVQVELQSAEPWSRPGKGVVRMLLTASVGDQTVCTAVARFMVTTPVTESESDSHLGGDA